MTPDAPHPPRLALWLLDRRVPEHEREFLVGDLVEAFQQDGGSRAARHRFWREAITASVRRERDLESLSFQRGIMTDVGFDLRLALRRLRRAPGFTLTTSLTLALGVGAACAIAAVTGPALWGALPFRDAAQIVVLRERFGDGSLGNVGYTTVQDVARRVASLESVSASASWQPTLRQGDDALRLNGTSVTAGWLGAVGTRVAIGRGFLPEEDRPDAPRVVVLSHGLWERHFGGDSAIVGRTIRLNEVMHQVVGVLPATHEDVLQQGMDILRPLGYADTLPWACRDCRHLQGVARLRRDVTLAVAQRELATVFERLRAEYPEMYGKNGIALTPLRARMVEGVRGPMYALLGAAALLLLIALANAVNLHVARAIRAGGEATVRAALGASRWRLVRGMVLEAMLTSALGALFGVAMASVAIRSLVTLAPASLPRVAQVRMDASTWALAAGLALALGLVSGLVPALLEGSRDLRGRLNAASRSVARGGHDMVRRSLVMLEVALALVLLGGAGVLVQSVQRLLAVDTGLATGGRLTTMLTVGGPRYQADAAVHATWRAVQDAVSAVPGVTATALTSQLPMSSDFDAYGIRLRSGPGQDRANATDAFRFAVSASYAQVMGIRVRQGRFLEPGDGAGTAPVVVINETLARRAFGARSPVGEQLQMGGDDTPWRTIVGVVADVTHLGLDAPPAGQFYLPLEQNHFADTHLRLVVQSSLDETALTPLVRDAVRRVDPSIPLAEVATMDALVARAATQRRFAERLFQVFSVVALVLAAVGIFGVIAGMVGERTREIGVRSALGATRAQILRHFLAEGSRLAAAGIAVGLGVALLLGGALRPLVFGISVRDPLTLGGCAAGLGLVALAGTLVPAWRATRVDANVALRSE